MIYDQEEFIYSKQVRKVKLEYFVYFLRLKTEQWSIKIFVKINNNSKTTLIFIKNNNFLRIHNLQHIKL